MEKLKPITAEDVQGHFRDINSVAPVCETCFHILEEHEDEDGIYLLCPNEMCLDGTQYYFYRG
tara:strand:- start:472 stop:660 length:189 start_codon:yes stop_codon:yes gene_type:complete